MNEFKQFIKDNHQKRLSNRSEAKIAQFIRVLDVLVFAPVLIYMGVTGKINQNLRLFLIVLAVASILYNGYYFIKYKEPIC